MLLLRLTFHDDAGRYDKEIDAINEPYRPIPSGEPELLVLFSSNVLWWQSSS